MEAIDPNAFNLNSSDGSSCVDESDDEDEDESTVAPTSSTDGEESQELFGLPDDKVVDELDALKRERPLCPPGILNKPPRLNPSDALKRPPENKL